MLDYARVDYVSQNQIQSFLDDGWEIIDKTKEVYDYGETSIRYHVGLTTKKLLEKYKEIFDDYERFGFKEELFKKISLENDEDIDDYDSSGKITSDKTPKYMGRYYKTIHNKNKSFYKKTEVDNEFF